MDRILFSVDTDGKALACVQVSYPDEYTTEGTAAERSALERAQYVDGAWIIHDFLQIAGPATAAAGEDFGVTVTLPDESPDTEVSVRIVSGGEDAELGGYEVTDGRASIPLSFETAGTYQISVSSRFHGLKAHSVVVS